MSFIGSMFDGSKGAGFQAQSAPVLNPTTVGQATDAYGNTQDALAKQKAFTDALTAQNGIQNQSNVFNQLQGVANGTGPNPAAAALNNATGTNVANTAALMASARGSAANPGLIARQAAQQGAGIQQNAAGQAAALQANQSLGALNQLGGIAGQQVGQQAGAVGTENQLAQNEQGTLLNSIQGENNANVSNVAQQNSANSGVAQANTKGQSDILGKIVGGAIGGGGAAAAAMAKGGEVGTGPKSMAAKHLFASKQAKVMKTGGQVSGTAPVKGNSYKNDTQPALLSAGEIVIPRSVTKGKDPVGDSAKFVAAILAKQGLKK